MPFVLGCPVCRSFPAGGVAFGDKCGCGATLRAWMLAPDCFNPKEGLAPVQIATRNDEIATPCAADGGVTLRELQRINQARSDRWMAGSPGWTKLEIAGELAGECGELANVCKKLRRSELGVRGNKLSDADLIEQARGELGDVFIVTMLVASKLGIDLYDATRTAFNRKSEEMGFPERFPLLEKEPA